MKKLSMLLFVVTILFISTNTAFAHTHLDSSNPEDGATVTESIDTIQLYFDTVIEDNASLQIENSEGEVVEASDITVNEDELIATFSEPIANGNYTVSWEIIGVDGHIMQESYGFAVNVPEEEVEEDTEEIAPYTENEEPTVEEDETTPSNNAADETESNSNGLLIGIILVAIVAIIAIFLLKRKK
ncbi:copper resistance protein CopC [Cytobacillus sp. Sa5YUA1]|uniref:Copper resistance protein CopC n=1 Tax=Cytobacillus stercorigallinarum TaxID=2762240 RepID=A0ABR8QS65_9BACI|nr:copper resistance protein CopC [Cytobacillus stercorigallinarum]MBD7938338.1 copper resistance protein CopC [Cytobacillus stercorigallinarum]